MSEMVPMRFIADFQREHAEELERVAEIKERQAIELAIEAGELRQRAGRLRMCLGYGALVKGAES